MAQFNSALKEFENENYRSILRLDAVHFDGLSQLADEMIVKQHAKTRMVITDAEK